jgi:hypothetical protein
MISQQTIDIVKSTAPVLKKNGQVASLQLKIKNVKLKIAISGGLYPPLIVDH